MEEKIWKDHYVLLNKDEENELVRSWGLCWGSVSLCASFSICFFWICLCFFTSDPYLGMVQHSIGEGKTLNPLLTLRLILAK